MVIRWRRPALIMLPSLAYLVIRELILELVFGSAGDWIKQNAGLFGDFIAWRWSSVIIAGLAALAIAVAWELYEKPWVKRFIVVLGGTQPAPTGELTTRILLSVRVSVSDFWGYFTPSGHVWIIHGLTITNKTNRRMSLDAHLELADQKANAVNHEIDMRQRPVAPVEPRLKVPIRIEPEDSVRGTLACESRRLEKETRERMIQGPWTLVLRDRLSDSEHKESLPPVGQVITAQLPEFPRRRRGLALLWHKLTSKTP